MSKEIRIKFTLPPDLNFPIYMDLLVARLRMRMLAEGTHAKICYHERQIQTLNEAQALIIIGWAWFCITKTIEVLS